MRKIFLSSLVVLLGICSVGSSWAGGCDPRSVEFFDDKESDDYLYVSASSKGVTALTCDSDWCKDSTKIFVLGDSWAGSATPFTGEYRYASGPTLWNCSTGVNDRWEDRDAFSSMRECSRDQKASNFDSVGVVDGKRVWCRYKKGLSGSTYCVIYTADNDICYTSVEEESSGNNGSGNSGSGNGASGNGGNGSGAGSYSGGNAYSGSSAGSTAGSMAGSSSNAEGGLSYSETGPSTSNATTGPSTSEGGYSNATTGPSNAEGGYASVGMTSGQQQSVTSNSNPNVNTTNTNEISGGNSNNTNNINVTVNDNDDELLKAIKELSDEIRNKCGGDRACQEQGDKKIEEKKKEVKDKKGIKYCKQLKNMSPERAACCYADFATKWYGNEREGVCKCVDPAETWNGNACVKIVVETPAAPAPVATPQRCYYEFKGEVNCNGQKAIIGKKIDVTNYVQPGGDCNGAIMMLNNNEMLRMTAICNDLFGNGFGNFGGNNGGNNGNKAAEDARKKEAIARARDNLKAWFSKVDSNKSVWKNADGSFNGARLASDLTAGVVLGTVGGVVSGVLIKKSQVEKGFDALNCTVGGQKIADWGDEFRVGLRR